MRRRRSRSLRGPRLLAARLASVENELRRIEGHLRPAPKSPVHKRVKTWVVAGLVALVGSSLFVLPDSLSLGYLFERRAFREKLDYYAGLVPDQCDLAIPELQKLRPRVRNNSLEHAWIQRSIALCFDAQSIDQEGVEARTSLLDARSKYEEAMRVFDDSTSRPMIGALFGFRKRYSREEHVRVLLRLAEVQRRLVFFEAASLDEARAQLERAVELSPTAELQSIAWNNLANVLNHLYVTRPPNRNQSPLLGPAEPMKLLRQAARLYWKALAMVDDDSATARSIRTNLATQHLLLAAAEAPAFFFLTNKGEVPETPPAIVSQVRMAFRQLHSVEDFAPLTRRGLLQPNFGLSFGFGTVVQIAPTAGSYRKVLRGSPANESPEDPIAQALHLADELTQSLGFLRTYGLTHAPEYYRRVIAHYETTEQYPFEYAHSFVGLGSCLVEMGMSFHGAHHFSEGMAALEKAIAVPDSDRRTLRIDRIYGIVRHLGGAAQAGGRDESTTTLALYNLWRAALFRSAFVDRKRMLDLATILSDDLVAGWVLGSPRLPPEIDSTMAYQAAILTSVLAAADEGRTRTESRFLTRHLQNAFEAKVRKEPENIKASAVTKTPQPPAKLIEWRDRIVRRY